MCGRVEAPGPGGPGGRAIYLDFLGPGAKERACGGGGPHPQETAMHAWGTRAGAGDSRSAAGGWRGGWGRDARQPPRAAVQRGENDSEGGPLPAVLLLYDPCASFLALGHRREPDDDAPHVVFDAFVLQLRQGVLFRRRCLERPSDAHV
jgi:hypothetical protein